MCCDTTLSSLTGLGLLSPLTVYCGGLIVFIKVTEVGTRGGRRAGFPATLFFSFFLFETIHKCLAFALSTVFLIRGSCQHTSAVKVSRRATEGWSRRSWAVLVHPFSQKQHAATLTVLETHVVLLFPFMSHICFS